MAAEHPELMLATDLAAFYDDPLGFVMYAFPWDTDPTLQLVKLASPWDLIYGSDYGPDAWACELLESIGQDVRDRPMDRAQAAIQNCRQECSDKEGFDV